MKFLVACEFSGVFRSAFEARGVACRRRTMAQPPRGNL